MVVWKHIRDESFLVPLLCVLLLTLILVSPVGDFPLNDDWIFAQTVQDILETGRYDGHPASAPLFLVQAYYGALLCKIFGFSFTVLRFSSMGALLVAAWATSRSASALGGSRGASLLAGVVIIANPLALNLGYTFMTDVPFMALAYTSMYFFIRAIQSGKSEILLAASGFAALSYFVRQFGLLIPVAFVASTAIMILRSKPSWNWKHAGALVAPWAIAALIIALLPESARGMSPGIDLNRMGSTLFGKLNNGIHHALVQLCYIAVFLLPLLLISLRKSIPSTIRGKLLLSGLIIWLGCQLITSKFLHMPFLPNMLYDLGVGPITLRGIVIDGILATPIRLDGIWWLITAVGFFGSLVILKSFMSDGLVPALSTESESENRTHEIRLFLFMLAAAFISVQFFPGLAILYDRYTVMALGPVAVFMTSVANDNASANTKRVAWSIALCMYLFSVIALQDYMAWNRARWQATDRIQSEFNVGPEDIDGGYEFNGWHTSQVFLENSKSPYQVNYGPKGGWVIRDTYAVSFHPRENFEQIGAVQYYSWLGFEEREILILKRTTDDEIR
jgi:hypothetical protein